MARRLLAYCPECSLWPLREMRQEAKEALYRMNVTYASLFPDLEGLARASAFELEMVWGRLIDDYRIRQAGSDAAPDSVA